MKWTRKVRERLPGLIMGVNDDTLEGVVARLFEQRGWSLALGEIFSGGVIAQRLASEGTTCFAGGEVLPLHALAGNNYTESARAFTQVVHDFSNRIVRSAWRRTPIRGRFMRASQRPRDKRIGRRVMESWIGLTQLRTGVTCLERIRQPPDGSPSPQK